MLWDKIMSTFYLVRHGHADWTNDENRPLSTRGREESNHVADVLQKYPIGAIYSSPFRRAYETISPLSKRLCIPVHIEPDLRERKIGNRTIEDFNKATEAMWRAPLFYLPEGESNSVAQDLRLAVRIESPTQGFLRLNIICYPFSIGWLLLIVFPKKTHTFG
jgi:2,3-bisphosphoglycerate-dependent phosphoglycerate mutase